MDKSTITRGTRWATWCIYFSYPYGALVTLCFVPLLLTANTTQSTLALMLLGTTAFLQVSASIGLRQGQYSGWEANNCVVWLTYLEIIFSGASSPDAPALKTFLCVVLGALVYLWPSLVYWRKRKDLFSASQAVPLPRQWMPLPIGAWVVVAGCVAAIVVSIWQSRNSDNLFNNYLNHAPSQKIEPNGGRVDMTAPTSGIDSAAFEKQQQRTWGTDSATYIRSHCQYQSRENRKLLQVAIDNLMRAGISNAGLLESANAQVLSSGQVLYVSNCPITGVMSQNLPSLNAGNDVAEKPKRPRCEYRTAMTDEEIARCQSN